MHDVNENPVESSEDEEVSYTKKDFMSDQTIRWCCSNLRNRRWSCIMAPQRFMSE